jgi:hypothetical protein
VSSILEGARNALAGIDILRKVGGRWEEGGARWVRQEGGALAGIDILRKVGGRWEEGGERWVGRATRART